MNFASRMSRTSVSPTLKVAAEADRLRRQGVDVVDLGAGEPDFGTPEHVKDAAHAALDANFTKYTPSAGVLELRDAVCQRYRLDYGVEIKPDEVKLARQVIGSFETEGDLTQYRDEYQDELRRIIDAKVAGQEVVASPEEAPPKVVNLMDALRESLERVSTTKKRAAKVADGRVAAAEARPARKRARA